MQQADATAMRLHPLPAPRSSEQSRQDLLALVEEARRLVATSPGSLLELAGPAAATGALRQLWHVVAATLRSGLAGSEGDVIAASADLADLLCRVNHLDELRADAEDKRRIARLDAIRQALTELHAATTVPDVVRMAPEIVCRLGFDRSMLSSVESSVWVTQWGHIDGDPEWAAEVIRVGREHKRRLGPDLREADVVRSRRSVVVRDVPTDPRVHQELAEATRARSYAAAPIVAGADVVGLLHADRFFDDDDVDEFDASVLGLFAEGLTFTLDKIALLGRLTGISDNLRGLDRTAPAVAPTTLTRREVEVADLMAAGLSNSAIAERLVVSEATVKSHVKHILRKLQAANRAEAVSRWLSGRALHAPSTPVRLRAITPLCHRSGLGCCADCASERSGGPCCAG